MGTPVSSFYGGEHTHELAEVLEGLQAGLALILHALAEPECRGLFTNTPLLPTLLKVLPRTPTIKLVVYDGEPKGTVVDDMRRVRNDIQNPDHLSR